MPDSPIELTEYTDSESIELEDIDREFVLRDLAGRISVRPMLESGHFSLNPSQYVGVAELPSGRQLRVSPKVPIASVFRMLSVAYEFPRPFLPQLAEYDRIESLFEFIAEYFADLVDERIRGGLYRTYVELEENLPVVRGRIVFAEDARANYVLRHKTFCRYAELTWDVPENQVLRQVAHLLSRWRFRPALRRRLAGLDAAMWEVSPTRHTSGVLDRMTYHRLNYDYRRMHQLCRLFLEGASLTNNRGDVGFKTFLLDMNRLFESYVTQVLADRCPAGLRVKPQWARTLDYDGKVDVRPDLTILKGQDPLLVADCKYKRLAEGEFKNHDVYQVLSYCVAIGVGHGVLIYPLGEVSEGLVKVRNYGPAIRIMSVDLDQLGSAMQDEEERFVRELLIVGAA